jgi:hypothetical protein
MKIIYAASAASFFVPVLALAQAPVVPAAPVPVATPVASAPAPSTN